jgi:leucyl-tRNA synthetase
LPTTFGRSQEELIKEIKKNEKISKYLQDKKIKKIIYIENKTINFVLA